MLPYLPSKLAAAVGLLILWVLQSLPPNTLSAKAGDRAKDKVLHRIGFWSVLAQQRQHKLPCKMLFTPVDVQIVRLGWKNAVLQGRLSHHCKGHWPVALYHWAHSIPAQLHQWTPGAPATLGHSRCRHSVHSHGHLVTLVVYECALLEQELSMMPCMAPGLSEA